MANPWDNDPIVQPQRAPAQPGRPPAFIPGAVSPLKRAAEDRERQDQEIQIESNDRARQDQGIQVSQNKYNNSMDLRKQFDAMPLVKSYRVALPQYAQALKTDNTPQGDLALIYAYAKVMDPDSVVREGEAAAVASADTLAGRTVARLSKELSGTGTFSPAARANLRREMQVKIAELNRAYNTQRGRFSADARSFGLDPVRILGEHDGKLFHSDIYDYWKRNPATNPMRKSVPPGGNQRRPQPASGVRFIGWEN